MRKKIEKIQMSLFNVEENLPEEPQKSVCFRIQESQRKQGFFAFPFEAENSGSEQEMKWAEFSATINNV